MDCPICFEKIINSAIGSCSHHFCYNCLLQWCKLNDQCPICKTNIREIRFDIEFDRLLNNNKIILNRNEKVIESNNLKITLINNTKGPGVKIKNVNNNLLKIGEIILFINGISIINHKQAIDIINHSIISNTNIKFILI